MLQGVNNYYYFLFLDECHDKIELGLLIDVSSSYGEGDQWLKVKLFTSLFLGYYDIDVNKTRLGVITYAQQPKMLFNLQDKEYQSLEAAKIAIGEALKDIKPQGKPLTEKALLMAHDVLFKLPPQNKNQRVLFVFTGGKTPNPELYEDIILSLEVRSLMKCMLLSAAALENLYMTKHARAFSYDVTAAILVFQNKEMAAILVFQTNPPGMKLYFYANIFF